MDAHRYAEQQHRLDLRARKLTEIGPRLDPGTQQPLNAYGMPVDKENNLYMLDFGSDKVSRIDAKTLVPTVYHTPTPGSPPPRAAASTLRTISGLPNTAPTGSPSSIRRPRSSTNSSADAETNTYDVADVKNGDVWTASMFTYRVVRLTPETGDFVQYPLPEQATNIRRVFIDNSRSAHCVLGRQLYSQCRHRPKNRTARLVPKRTRRG